MKKRKWKEQAFEIRESNGEVDMVKEQITMHFCARRNGIKKPNENGNENEKIKKKKHLSNN